MCGAGQGRPEPMKIGAVFPQIEIGADPGAIRAYAEALEDIGFDHILAYDHVLGADPAAHPGWSGAYSSADTFHEPFVLFGYLAGFSSLELATGILILPQRQTALVAKQAAQVDVLSEGRLRLGVGIGWNEVEYDGLGIDFHRRGRRLEEQVGLLRRLWTEPALDFDGPDERIDGAGINPLPAQRPIPVWMGATRAPRALHRVGRLADGWMPQFVPGSELDETWATIRDAAREAGRDPDELGLDGRIAAGDRDLDRVATEAAGWRDRDATHVSLNTMRAGLESVDDHIAVLREAFEVVAEEESPD